MPEALFWTALVLVGVAALLTLAKRLVCAAFAVLVGWCLRAL